MSNFFSKFPKLIYNNIIVTDLLARISVVETYQNNVNVYYPYSIQEGDTPEIIATKYYNDPERHWIVMLMNNITDPFFEFPMEYDRFNIYLDNKYKSQGSAINRRGSEYASMTPNIDPSGYRAIITTISQEDGTETVNKFFIDKDTYESNQYTNYTQQFDSVIYNESKEIVTIYEYEQELNEAKREIKLLRKEYVNQFESELKKLMSLKYV